MQTNLTVKKIAQLTGHNGAVYALSPDEAENNILSGAGDGWVVRWNLDDPENGRLIAKIETNVFALYPLLEQRRVVAGNMNGGVHWIHLDEPERTKNIAHHRKGVYGIERIGEHLYTLGGSGMLTRWSIEETRTLESFQLTNESLRGMDFSAKRHEIAIGASDNHIYLLDAETLALKAKIAAHENSVFTVKYNPDETHLLSGSRDAHLKVWDLDTQQAISSQPAHWFTINHIAFHPQGQWFATASRDKTIKIWDAATFELLKVIDTFKYGCHVNSVNRLFWTPHNNYLLSGSDDRTIIVWKIE